MTKSSDDMTEPSKELTTTRRVLGSILFPLLGLFIVYWLGPQLLAEYRGGPTWYPAPELHVEEAKCTTHMFVFSDCAITYSEIIDPSKTKVSLNYLKLGYWGSEPIRMLRSASNASTVTVGFALNQFWWRAISLAIFAGAPLLMGLGAFMGLIKKFKGSAEPVGKSYIVVPDSSRMREPARNQPSNGRAQFGMRK